MEEWKDIKGYEGLYQISNYGNCKSLDRIIERKTRWGDLAKIVYKGKILSPNKVGGGYLKYDLCKNGKYQAKSAHRLVYETFVDNIPEGMEIDHIDCNRENNNVKNLRCVTRKENMHNPVTYKKYFIPCSEEKKKKMSETSKGKHYSPETEFKKGYHKK